MGPSEEQPQSVERDQVDDILVSFREWLSVQEDRWRRDAEQNDFHVYRGGAAGRSLHVNQSEGGYFVL